MLKKTATCETEPSGNAAE